MYQFHSDHSVRYTCLTERSVIVQRNNPMEHWNGPMEWCILRYAHRPFQKNAGTVKQNFPVRWNVLTFETYTPYSWDKMTVEAGGKKTGISTVFVPVLGQVLGECLGGCRMEIFWAISICLASVPGDQGTVMQTRPCQILNIGRSLALHWRSHRKYSVHNDIFPPCRCSPGRNSCTLLQLNYQQLVLTM